MNETTVAPPAVEPARRPQRGGRWRLFVSQLGRRGRAGAPDYFFQIVIVILGVYLGITLESNASDRQATKRAQAALVQLVDDLERDDADMTRVQREQQSQARDYQEIAAWLAAARPGPAPRIDSLLWKVTTSPTVYPRRGIYASMVSAGQFAMLPEAVRGEVVNLYENIYTRLAANGEHYDYSLERDFFPAFARSWDPIRKNLMSADEAERVRFRNIVLLMATWSNYYARLVAESQGHVREVMADIKRR